MHINIRVRGVICSNCFKNAVTEAVKNNRFPHTIIQFFLQQFGRVILENIDANLWENFKYYIGCFIKNAICKIF